MTQLVDAPRDVAEDPAPPRAGRSRALLGLVPFVLYLLVFLGGPLYFVISGALSDPDGRPTLENVVAALTEPQYHARSPAASRCRRSRRSSARCSARSSPRRC